MPGDPGEYTKYAIIAERSINKLPQYQRGASTSGNFAREEYQDVARMGKGRSKKHYSR